MNNGYSIRMAEKMKKAPLTLGVKLGRLCVKKNISAATIAKKFGVSKVTVYNWFSGKNNPNQDVSDAVRKLIATLKA